jgi:Ala-tRNA(Pro) deacylase
MTAAKGGRVSVPQQVREFLDKEGVSYEVLAHERAFTAQGVAAALHVSGWTLAKPVILRTTEGRLVMAVLTGAQTVNLRAAAALVGAEVELAQEKEFVPNFPGCEAGAEPPFGNLYGLPVYVDEALRRDPEIVFNAGTHTEAIRMKYADYERLVGPDVGRLAWQP